MHDAPQKLLKKVCRALGLSALYLAWFNRSRQPRKIHEGRKIAIHGDRKSAALAMLVHLIPTAACIGIVALNLRGYYIGGELAGPSGQDTEKLAGLQFAAKLHELTMNASLATMLFSYIRYQVTFGGGLPFGAMFAGLQFKDLSFLWSMELFGAAQAKSYNVWRRRTLVALITGFTLLGVSVGPSSANILKPRLDWWPAGGTDFWINATRTELFPLSYLGSQVPPSCAIYTGNTSCPSGDWTTLASHYLSFWSLLQSNTLETSEIPISVSVSGAQSVRDLGVHGRSPYELYPGEVTLASVSFSAVADALGATGQIWKVAAWNIGHGWRFRWRLSDNFVVAAPQPAVSVRCSQNTSSISQLSNGTTNYTLAFYNLSDSVALSESGDFPLVPYDNSSLLSIVGHATNASTPSLSWVQLPTPSFGNASLGIAVVIPTQKGENATINLCTVDASLGPAISQTIPGEIKFVTSVLPANMQTWDKIAIEPAWAEYLFPQDPVTNIPVFDQMLAAAGLWNLTANSTFGVDNVPYVLETLFAASIVNGLARANYDALIAGTLKDDPEWMVQMLPVNGSAIGYGGNAFDLGAQALDTVTPLTLRVQAQGYAYSARGSTTVLSVVILLLYCALAVAHCAYMLGSGLSSSSWDSISEITTLAMNSAPTKALVNTGAGIETAAVFQEMVRVAADGERLQFVFEEGPQGAEMVEKDVFYS